MQIEIYNMTVLNDKLNISLEAVCDSFSSLLWDIEYYKCGAFEVYIAASPRNIEIFQTGRIVGRDDDREHFGLIESVELETDAEDGDYLIIKGRFLMCLLERRIIYPTLNFTSQTSYGAIVQKAVENNALASGNRLIPGLKLGKIQGACWDTETKLQVSYDNLMEWVYTICKKIGGTANIRLSKIAEEQYEMIFDLLQGEDRSILQKENPHIVFSDSYNNLLSFTYFTDTSVKRNFAYVLGKGEGEQRKRTTCFTNSEPALLDRYEVYVDAKDISDEEQPRYMAVGICCNTSENVRNVSFEILAGTPATNPAIPRFQNTDYKKYLTLCIIRLDAGTLELSITDYRENNNFCGYVRCILGKCKVTDMLSQLAEIQTQIKDYNITVGQLTTKINELTLKIDEMTGDVVSIGKCGQSVDFVLYSDGRLLLKGTGATFDYSTDSNPSPFQNNSNIKSVIVSEGVTGIGERLFQYCDNLKTVSLGIMRN